MVRNLRGGNKAKKAKKNYDDNTNSRPLRLKDKSPDSDELYANVISRLGGEPPRVQVICENGIEKRCVIRGKFKKKIWINANDVLIIIYDKSKNDGTGEVVHKYNPTEISKLHSLGHLNEHIFSKPEDLKNDDNVEFDVETKKDYYTMINDNLSKTKSVSDLDKINDTTDIYNLDEESDSDIDIEDI